MVSVLADGIRAMGKDATSGLSRHTSTRTDSTPLKTLQWGVLQTSHKDVCQYESEMVELVGRLAL